MAKSLYIENVGFDIIIGQLRKAFADSDIKIIISLGTVHYPLVSQRHAIIEEIHCSAIGGHKGVTKTYNRIKQKYRWENMKNDVAEFIQKCLQCQLKKLVRVKTKQKMIITDLPPIPFAKVALDIVGPLPKTEKGNEYILTMQDLFSKFVIGVALADQTAVSVADGLVRKLICTFGIPQVILTDQGTNFMSKMMAQLAKRLKIKQIRSTAFHAQSNGSLERSHAPLVEYLKMFVVKAGDWDDWVELAMFNYNTGRHEGTRHTPFELVFGRIARVPASDDNDAEAIPTYSDYLKELITRLNSLHEIARNNLSQSKNRYKFYYDKKVNVQEIKVGDFVYLLSGPKVHKFDNQYSGPYLVLETWDNGNVRIRINKKTNKVVHSNRLRFSRIEPNDEN